MSDKETSNKQLGNIGKVRTHNILGHGVIAGDFQHYHSSFSRARPSLHQTLLEYYLGRALLCRMKAQGATTS